VLDEAAFNSLLADLGTRLTTTQDALRDLLVKELGNHPAVGLRRSAVSRDTALTILALPGTALAPDDNESAAELATSDLLCEDPREALVREVRVRWGESAVAFSEEEIDRASAELGPGTGIAGSRVGTVLRSFAPLITAHLGDAPDSPTISWRLLTGDQRRQAALALARFHSEETDGVDANLIRALAAARQPPPVTGFYYAASADALEVATLLPKTAALHRVPLDGVPAARERIILIQGDLPGVTNGLFSQVCDRLAASLGAPGSGSWVASLIERHATRMRPIAAERKYRRRVLILDPEKLEHLATGLSARLSRLGVPTSVLDVERKLADVRRIADKEWEGEGHDDPLPLFSDVPHHTALALAETGAGAPSDLMKRFDGLSPELPGIRVSVAEGRDHPFGDSLVHLLGTLGRVEQELDYDQAVERGLDPAGWIGQSGTEKTYDQILRGHIGRRVALRSPEGVQVLDERPAEDGHDLTTELDMEVQTICEKSLDNWYELAEQLGTASGEMDSARAIGRGRAGMVVIDCHTGGILALASSPRYKPDDLAKNWEALTKDPAEPLHDHAAEGAQPPGSALKILTALACLENGVVSPGEPITTKGYMALVAGRKVLRSHAPAGTYTLADAIQISDNCYFATIGQRLGAEKLSNYFARFGMGTRMALDVPQQKAGILPMPGTRGHKWLHPSDTWRLAIGQFSTASPLQVACIAAAVANGGHVVHPFIVKPKGAPEVVDLHVRADWLEDVRHGMEQVTAPGGTAKYLNLSGAAEGIQVAAKTGTSEWGNTDPTRFPDHAWLIGYAPADEPKVAFAIFIHSGTSGGRACSGVAKQVLETYFSKYGRAGHARIVEEPGSPEGLPLVEPPTAPASRP
jgi:penicillin-binding protein 2